MSNATATTAATSSSSNTATSLAAAVSVHPPAVPSGVSGGADVPTAALMAEVHELRKHREDSARRVDELEVNQ